MQKFTILVLAGLLTGCASHAAVSLADLPPPSKHDQLETPYKVKSSDLQYGQGRDLGHPDSFAPIITALGTYPTEHDALHAFQRADHKYFGAYKPRIFACAPGAFNGETALVEQYAGKPVVYCSTVFLDRVGHRLGQIPVNYYYWKAKWQLRDPATVFAALLWANIEPTLPQVRGKAVQ